MATILWLDDRPDEVRESIERLRGDGHAVRTVTTEDSCLGVLVGSERPDLVIQDLHRASLPAQLPGGPDRTPTRDHWSAGWRFYSEVLRPFFPSLPIVICTYDVNAVNRSTGDEYNLEVIGKMHRAGGGPTAETVSAVVERLLAAQRTLHESPDGVPSAVYVDFERITGNLIAYLSRNPTELHKVGWQKFELLIARLLEETGYEVAHTPLTRDGGVDLWALKRDDLGTVQYAIDVKKYSPDRIIGPQPVRSIYGVVQAEGASVGMIVTTSRFGPKAIELAEQLRYRLALKDFEDVVEWMRLVDSRG